MARIIITGANEGIGFHMASQFLQDGHMVSILDLKLNNLQPLKEKYTDALLLFECDVRNPQTLIQSTNDTVSAFGGIDYAIHNAAKCPFTNLEDTADDEYRDVFDVNYHGAINIKRGVRPLWARPFIKNYIAKGRDHGDYWTGLGGDGRHDAGERSPEGGRLRDNRKNHLCSGRKLRQCDCSGFPVCIIR